MALSFSILYTIVDGKGTASTTEVKVPSATDFADVVLFGIELAKLIDPLITGAFRRIGVALSIDFSAAGLTAVAADDSDVEEGARFQFVTDGGFYTGMRIPTFDEQFIVTGGTEVDTDPAAVAAFVTAMTAGIDLTGVGGSGTIEPSDQRDDDIAALSYAREQFLSSRG